MGDLHRQGVGIKSYRDMPTFYPLSTLPTVGWEGATNIELGMSVTRNIGYHSQLWSWFLQKARQGQSTGWPDMGLTSQSVEAY
jgi:hypothetical protein